MDPNGNWVRRPLLAAALVLGITLSACSSGPTPVPIQTPTAASSPSGDALARYYDQKITWHNCGDAECTHITVPLDYADPASETTELAVSKYPAKGETKLGTLFVQPGGPGGSAFDFAKLAPYVVSPALLDAYDIVGVDPRGVAKSDPIECLTDAERDALLMADATPDDAAEEQHLVDVSAAVGKRCAENAAEMTPHIGTVNVARDYDIARAVLGDPTFNYLGFSYGTSIGAVYAELFPQRIGRMVLDGVMPPQQNQVEATHDQAVAFDEAFNAFVEDCATQRDCPFEGDAAQVRTQLLSFLQDLDANPVMYDDRAMDESLATYTILTKLYFPPGDFEELRGALNPMVKDGDASKMFNILDVYVSRGADGTYIDNSTDAFYAVTCADSTDRPPLEQVRQLASDWQADAPVFGESLAWGLLSCSDWPKVDAPATGQLSGETAPILVVATTHDPATPYAWGEQVAQSLGNATLLTWDAHHHTAYQAGSACIDGAVDAYLLAGTLPAPGTRCD